MAASTDLNTPWERLKSFYVEHRNIRLFKYYRKFRRFTMVRANEYADSIRLCLKFRHIPGVIVECGVWRGGMSAGIADALNEPNREYFLFDSFEGLPNAKEIDGESALEWQHLSADKTYNNCTAEMGFAEEAMRMAGAKKFKLVKGWFKDTLPGYSFPGPIAILRLDGDWYDSTMECLQNLYPKVSEGGLIIIDDYHVWDGCSKAVHDYLSSISTASRISQSKEGVCFIVKK